MNVQKTKLQNKVENLSKYFGRALIGPWKRRCIGILSILIGYYLGTTITGYYLEQLGNRPIFGLLMVMTIEVLVRFRSQVTRQPWPIEWLIVDNLRIGTVYAVVLEAFKLGS